MVIGKKYEKLYQNLEQKFIDYAKKCEAELCVFQKPLDETFHRSILSQKLLIASKTTNYDMVAFLDLDLIINQEAPSIFDFLSKDKYFGAVLDPRGTNEFIATWQHIPRIIAETSENYFTDRNFKVKDNLLGSINGGVFVMRPKLVAKLFSDYYFSDHNQGTHNSHEEAPMAYLTQVHHIFEPLPITFNTQVLYKLKGTEKGRNALEAQTNANKRKRWLFKSKKTVISEKYQYFINEELQNTHILHFAGNYPIPINYYCANNKTLSPKDISISYGITVCNEAVEIEKLLKTLIPLIDKNDEIIILQDITEKNLAVETVLNKYQAHLKIVQAKLNNDFATFKNNLIFKASKKYLFQLDADEIPKTTLIKNIKPFLSKEQQADAFFVPRINIVNNITSAHIEKWKWNVNEKGYINFPDYQARILKLNAQIFWKNKVHELLYGYKKNKQLPNDEDFCLLHIKDIKKQEQQNNFYDTLE